MWFFYALFAAIWGSISTFIIKRLTGEIEPLPLLFTIFLFSIPSIFILLMFTGGIPHATTNFFIFMFISALIDIVAFTSQFNAIKISPISLIGPIESFSPLFTVIIAIFILHEIPTPLKFIGILLIVLGAYLLNVSDAKKNILAPFKDLIKNRGIQLASFATFLWAVTPSFQKKAIFETSPQVPLFASFIGMCIVTLLLAPFLARKTFSYKREIYKNIKFFILLGILGAIFQLAVFTAFSLTGVGYVTAVMRLSGLFTVVLGAVFLKEKRIRERFIAAIVMIFGVLLLVL